MARPPVEYGFYVDLRKTAGGDLEILLNRNGRRHFSEIREQRDAFGIYAALCALLEDHLCSGWEMVLPEDIGALMAVPILSDEINRDDHGKGTRLAACTGIPTTLCGMRSKRFERICYFAFKVSHDPRLRMSG